LGFFIWVYFILVKRFPTLSFFFKVGFIQDCGLFRVQFWQVYTGVWFIQGSVLTGLYRIVVYSGFSFDRFIQDCGLFRVQFWQVYTGCGLFRVQFWQISMYYKLLLNVLKLEWQVKGMFEWWLIVVVKGIIIKPQLIKIKTSYCTPVIYF
jgi:hypothetical protein